MSEHVRNPPAVLFVPEGPSGEREHESKTVNAVGGSREEDGEVGGLVFVGPPPLQPAPPPCKARAVDYGQPPI